MEPDHSSMAANVDGNDLGGFSQHSGNEDSIAVQFDALMALYKSMNGAGWRWNRNWGTSAPFSKWFGIECDSNGNVVKINLNNSYEGNNLQGTCHFILMGTCDIN